MLYANNKCADQPAHLRSLISAFVVHCLDSIMALVSISEISSLYLVSVSAKACLCLTWSQTPKTGFLVTRLIFNIDVLPKWGLFCPVDCFSLATWTSPFEPLLRPAKTQADLSLCWGHMQFRWFCHEAAPFDYILHKFLYYMQTV